jgi:predicted HTH transcriptional regulator
MGYAAGFEAAIAYVNSQLPQNEHIGRALRQEVRIYPEIAIRELVANTLIHQDFSMTGAGPMVEIFDARMEFTNPGEPLVDLRRFIDTPPRSRNENLASFMRRVNICEERGSDIDKVIFHIEMFHFLHRISASHQASPRFFCSPPRPSPRWPAPSAYGPATSIAFSVG